MQQELPFPPAPPVEPPPAPTKAPERLGRLAGWTPTPPPTKGQLAYRKGLETRRRNRLALKAEYEQQAIVRQMNHALNGRQADDDIREDGISPSRDQIGDLGPYSQWIWLAAMNGGRATAKVDLHLYADAVRRLGWRVARDLAFNSTYFQEKWPV